MKYPTVSLLLSALVLPLRLGAACFTDPDVVAWGQTSWAHKKPSLWQIEGRKTYSSDNGYGDLAVKYSDECALIDSKLGLDFSVYGLAWAPYQGVGAFEQDGNRLKVLLDKVRLSYTVSDSIRLDAGKLSPQGGLFYLKSPASLLNNYYAGFKPTRIYHPAIKPGYTESFWGALLAQDTPTYSLSLTLAPELAAGGKRYQASGNWSATQRANASDRYLLTYTDYRFTDHTPALNIMLGEQQSIALSDSVNLAPQLIFNSELAYHLQQAWRHLDQYQVDRLQRYDFPSQLYSAQHEDGVELALGIQYTTDLFSQFGAEYYFQSEGYSAAQWQKQSDLVKFLDRNSGYAALNRAFDAYKYLLASEIYNTSGRGYLQGKHYLHTYARFLLQDQSSVQPYAVLNLRDKSALVGITVSKAMNKRLDLYAGVYSAFGSSQSEFGLFGENIVTYLGVKFDI